MRSARKRRLVAWERGAVPVEFALGAGLLVLPIAALVTVFPTWSERQSMARVAAQEAARTVVLADDWTEGTGAGGALATQIAVNHGLAAGDLAVVFAGALDRGGAVTTTVTVPIPGITIPGIGEAGGFSWSVTHTERVDDYRSFEP